MSQAAERREPLAGRLWRYQGERFPVFKHGLLIAVFAFAAVAFAGSFRIQTGFNEVWTAFLLVFLLFAQLRVADEHKDYADDLRFRPERAVPRGLVSLAELRLFAGLAAAVQVGLALSIDVRVVGWLLLAWVWMGLMTAEFFAPAFLKARPVLYLVSHMLVMPLIALLAVACGSFGQPHHVPGVAAFLALSFLNGVALEIGRKTWGPEDEREGVETYSRLWGPRRAAAAVVAALLAAALAAGLAIASRDGGALGFISILPPDDGPGWLPLAPGVLALAAVAAALPYLRRPSGGTARLLETATGLFTLASYLLVAVGPWFS
jgi:4-hydroxybenzoate polyprenyltransferase